MYGMIATWRMAYEGVEDAVRQLAKGTGAGDALVAAIRAVEDEEYYKLSLIHIFSFAVSGACPFCYISQYFSTE